MIHDVSLRGRRCMGLGLAVLALVSGAAASTGTPSSSDYQAPAIDRYLSIISRQPFGLPPPPPPPPPTPPVAAAVADPGRNVVLFEIVRSMAGDVIVGFTDNSARPPRSLLLAIGEEAEGYKVVFADLDAETATIEKDGVSFDVRMSNSAGTPAGKTPFGASHTPAGSFARPTVPSGAGSLSMAEYASRMASQTAQTPTPAVSTENQLSPGGADNSYAARLKERREQMARQVEADKLRREQDVQTQAQKASVGEINKRLRETNMNLLRKGLKPIGTVELTPEEDAQLVKEGVLPER